MKRLTGVCALLSLTCLPATAARAQAGSAIGPTFGASWVLPTTSDATHHLATFESTDLSGRLHLGIAVPGGEVYVVAARLTALGPEHAFVQATATEPWRDTDHRIRLTGGSLGIRPYVLDGTVRLAPYLETGAGWFESISTTQTMPGAMGSQFAIRPVQDTERHHGWARTMAGGVTAELRLGGGFGLGLHAGLTDVRPSSRALRDEIGEPRLYHAGAMIAWSPEPRRWHRPAHAGSSKPRDGAAEPAETGERAEGVPGRIVIGRGAEEPPVTADARVGTGGDGVPEVRLQGDPRVVALLADHLAAMGEARVRLLQPPGTETGAPDIGAPDTGAPETTPETDAPLDVEPAEEASAADAPRSVTLDVRLADGGSAALLALLPEVQRVDALTVRVERRSVEDAARFLEFVLTYRR